jgi:two-component system sensor histidine kinase KdpD
MDPRRPDPDALLKRCQEEETRATRGKLKIFFGATAGVGKTYAMLEAAHEQKDEGVDVVAGVVVTHGRVETESLLHGLVTLPPRVVNHQGVQLEELDLDAALARRPTLILIDELAHTNAPASRHPKRWQDVEELLASGISVYTTVNVQHMESLNDVVSQITGIRVRETVPDSVLERADDVELIDLPPDDLLQRLKEGKVYVPEQARHALDNFFRKGNLIALRELALRRTAERVDQQMEVYRRDHAVVKTWPAGETIMVCVNLNPRGLRLVRAARSMAAGLHAKWIAIYVQTSRHLGLSEVERSPVFQTLRLAEQLGAEAVTLTGEHVSQELLDYARSRNVTKIIVGKPLRSRWKEWLLGSVVNELVRDSGDIDLYVITAEGGESRPRLAHVLRRTSRWSSYGYALLSIAACTAVTWIMYPYFSVANLIMIYLLGVVIVATRWGRGPSIFASVMSVAAFDFFFIPPYFTFAISDIEYMWTFGVMLTVAVLISSLAAKTKQQAEAARYLERRTGVLYAMSRDLATHRGVDKLTDVACRHLQAVFESQVAVFLPDDSGRVALQRSQQLFFEVNPKEAGVAQWVFDHKERAGLGTDTLPGATALYLPLLASRGPIGVVALRPAHPSRLINPEQIHLLETFANQVALAIERARLTEETQQAHVQAATERMRSAILSSVSHDLRTPLATITGAASSLLTGGDHYDDIVRRQLAQAIYEEGHRLDRLLKNLIDMTRLEAGGLQLKKERHPMEEVIGSALHRLERRLEQHRITTHLPATLSMVPMDAILIEQVFINLIDNAVAYAPPEGAIEISVMPSNGMIVCEIADRGPGVQPGDEQRIFEKFYRGTPKREGGLGLGLTICQGIIEAHGGRIWAENRPGGGAIVRFTLPLDDYQDVESASTGQPAHGIAAPSKT